MLKSRCWVVLGLVVGVSSFVPLAQAADAAKPAVKKVEPAKPGPATPKKKLGPAPDKPTSAKVSAYIDLINQESEHLFSMRDTWLKAIDRKAGPTCKEKVSLETTIGPDGGRYDIYRKRLKAKPALPPDAAALKMVDAVQELRKIGERPGPHNEYQAKGTPGEWCQQLKAVFPLLLAAFDKYEDGNREVRAYVDTFTDERDLRELDSTQKKYGKHYRYQFAALTVEGKIMMRAIRAELAKSAPDAAAVREKIASYLALADETKTMMDAEPKNAKTEPYPNTFRFFLIESVPKLKRASDALLTSLAQKPDPKQAERLDRDWGSVVTAYNEIIGYMNQISFEQKQK